MTSPAWPTDPLTPQDAEHLKALAICHYVMAGLMAVMGFLPIIHVSMGIAMLSGAFPVKQNDFEQVRMMGGLFAVLGGFAMLLSWSLALAIAISGRSLQQRKRYNFSFIVACLMCLNAPLGTILGVFTILVLVRPTVKAAYEQRKLGVV